MSEKEKIKEMRRRNLKRAIFMGAIVLLLVRRSLRKRRKRAAEAERCMEAKGIA